MEDKSKKYLIINIISFLVIIVSIFFISNIYTKAEHCDFDKLSYQGLKDSEIKRLKEIEQDIIDTAYSLGLKSHKKGQYKSAVKFYSTALEVQSYKPQIYRARAESYKKLDNNPQAKADLEEAAYYEKLIYKCRK